jgi:hypothetical protein
MRPNHIPFTVMLLTLGILASPFPQTMIDTAFGQISGGPIPYSSSPGSVMQSNMSRYMMGPTRGRTMPTVIKLGEQQYDMRSGFDDEKKVFIKHIELVGAVYMRNKEMQPLFQPYENREVSIGELHTLCDSIDKLYQDKGHYRAFTYVPSQKLKDGSLRIVANEW